MTSETWGVVRCLLGVGKGGVRAEWRGAVVDAVCREFVLTTEQVGASKGYKLV